MHQTFSHIMNIYHFKVPKLSILITKNTLHQLNLEEKNVNPVCLGKNFMKDKNGNSPLDKKILAELQLKYCIPLMFN